jgi:hypothetical protein
MTMNSKFMLGVFAVITLGTTLLAFPLQQQAMGADESARRCPCPKAPPAITGDNVYVAWWTNKTGNDEVLFRASTDAGKTLGDKINLSNTTDADSRDVEIDSDANSVVVTWWETNETSNIPVMRVSDDNGKTFGPLLNLATNGTLGESPK